MSRPQHVILENIDIDRDGNLDDASDFTGNPIFSGNPVFSGSPDFTGSTPTYGDSVTVGQDIIHAGDADTKITFGTDSITFDAGGLSMLTLAEAGSDTATIVGDVTIRQSGGTPGSDDVSMAHDGTNFTLINNTASGRVIVSNTNGALLEIAGGSNAQLLFDDNTASSNETQCRFTFDGGTFSFDTYNDASSYGSTAFRVLRTGTTVDEFEVNATTFDLNGALDVSGSVTLAGTALTATATELNKNDVTAQAETIDSGAAASVTVKNTKIDNTTSGAGAITLAAPDASMYGLVKTIEMIVDNGDVTLSLVNVQGGSAATTATFADVNDTLIMVGGTSKWHVIGESGVVLS